jgi:hypothetical protein
MLLSDNPLRDYQRSLSFRKVAAMILCNNIKLSCLNKSFLISKLNCYYCIMMNIPKDIISMICVFYLNIIRELYLTYWVCVIQDNDGTDYLPKLLLPYS